MSLSRVETTYSDEAIAFAPNPPGSVHWLEQPEKIMLGQQELVSYLAQLEEEGFAVYSHGGKLEIAWGDLYRLFKHPSHESSLPLLGLPAHAPARPRLSSRGALDDADFGIFIDGWVNEGGNPLAGRIERSGGLVRLSGTVYLLPEDAWRLLEAVKVFAGVPESERNRERNFREWGRIRALAKRAKATLDRFLEDTVVLTPEKLRLDLRKSEVGGGTVVEVIPAFDGAPNGWLGSFDRGHAVPPRYDISTDSGGIVHVVVDPVVRRVLAQIKRMPNRRVVGMQAEAFLRNPYALLGEEAEGVLPPEAFESARAAAGVEFYGFSIEAARDGSGTIARIDVAVFPVASAGVAEESHLILATPDKLQDFLNKASTASQSGQPCFDWEGHMLEIDSRTRSELARGENLLVEWRKARLVVSFAEVYDLSCYSPRVEEIGVARPVYSPFIARTGERRAWIPETVSVGVAFKPKDSDTTILLPVDQGERVALASALDKAKAVGKTEFQWPGLPTPISIHEAELLIRDIEVALGDIGAGKWPDGPPIKEPEPQQQQTHSRPPTLLIAHNIEAVEYSECRREALKFEGGSPKLPTALKSYVELFLHQQQGVAWLQHLWKHAPEYARGCILADDMGLGKTLQLLTFLLRVFEDEPDAPPALIVVPVALLLNWAREAKQYFNIGVGDILMLYGSSLSRLRVSQSEIDEQLRTEGLTRFLRPGWHGGARIVLTSYETLRDYELSLAREKWSVMVCDEAQKIKSPAAMVTQAAKKMNARFKIAATGTPVENSLTDLWCLFDFIQPGLLGALNEFGRKYKRPIEAKSDQERAALEEFQELIAPQVLRRTKEEVLDIPKKSENLQEIPICVTQRNLYSQAITAHKNKISAADSKKKGQATLGMLHHLRVLCADPRPPGSQPDISLRLAVYAAQSPKLGWLMQRLEDIRERKEKVIIFTEWRDIQRVIQHYVGEHFGFRPVIINGDTDALSERGPSRQNLIDHFQRQPGFGAMVLSTSAVGFGLNVQAANHVIHFTRPWNPAKEDQATDRAHRIGQTKPVTVYYPTVVANDFVTFEQRLAELLAEKRDLAKRTWLNGADEIRAAEFGNLGASGDAAFPNRNVGEADIFKLDGAALETLCTLLWKKQGFHAIRTPQSGDGGVDVVVWRDDEGYLIQCKASSQEGHALGWEAVKDVAAGAAAYERQYSGVKFRRLAVTNQKFNDNARKQAKTLCVDLVERQGLLALLAVHPVQVQEFWMAVSW